MTGRQWAMRVVRIVCTLAALAFLGWQVWRVRDGLAGSMRTVGLSTALLAGTLTFVGGIPSILGWRMILAGLGTRLDLPVAVKVHFLAGLTGYLPGAIWPTVAHAAMARSLRQPPARLAAAALASQGLGVAAGLAVGLLALPRLVAADPTWWLLVPVVVCALVPIAVPRLLATLLAVARRVLRRGTEPLPLPDRGALLAASGLMALGWLIGGTHVVVLASAFGADPRTAVTVGIGGYALSVLAGGASIVLPRGLGARELVLGLTLATVLSGPDLVAVVALSRVLATVFEAGTTALVLGVLSLLPRAALSARPNATEL